MRAPHENESPAPREGGNGAIEIDQAGNQTKHIDTPPRSHSQVPQAVIAVDVLAKHTADLAVIADWRDELHAKIRRAQMRLELVDLDLGEQADIADEVQAFKQLCRALMATMAKPEAMAMCAATRRAA